MSEEKLTNIDNPEDNKDIKNMSEDLNTTEATIEADNVAVPELSNEETLTLALADEKAKYLRLFAEFENYKKRTLKEKGDLVRTANQDLIVKLLPVLDDFERGMKEIEKSEDKNLVTGVTLIQTKLNEVLINKGLERFEAVAGDSLNIDLHEAITQIPAPNEALKGKIIDCVESGYTLKEKVIRYAKVVVAQS